jgi:NMD protein affecting ribosome stability and mRNA decay
MVGSLCEEHYTQRHELFDVEPLSLKVCSGCDAVFDRKWQQLAIEDAIRAALRRSIKDFGKVERVDIDMKKVGNDYVVTVTATGCIPPAHVAKSEIKTVTVRVGRVKCPTCIKLSGHYHEAVIQIRGERADELVELIEKVIGVLPGRKERLKYGWNLYLVHKADARMTVRRLEAELKRQEKPRVDVVRSYKLVGKKDGKELWRDFYVLR